MYDFCDLITAFVVLFYRFPMCVPVNGVYLCVSPAFSVTNVIIEWFVSFGSPQCLWDFGGYCAFLVKVDVCCCVWEE